VEEDTGWIYGADTDTDADELATFKYGRGQAATSSSWEETGTTSACGPQACGPEVTRETTRSNYYETSARAGCAATGRKQVQWFGARTVGPGSSCKILFCNFYNANAKLSRSAR